jgi:signal transduction histidine kinase
MNPMSAEAKQTDNLAKNETRGVGNGRFLWLVWAGWTSVFLLVLGLFAASLPYAVVDVKYYEWQVLQARPAAATIFPTYDAFVTYLLVLRLTAVAVFWGTAVYIVWHKPKEWMVVYVSATLLMMSYMLVFQSDMDRWRFPDALLKLIPAAEWITPLLFLICFFLLFYLFPDGRFLPKWIGVLGLAITGISILFFGQLETDLNLSEETAWVLFVFSIFVFALVGLFSQVLKWRKATVVEKQQTRLVLFALGLFIALPFIQSIIGLFVGDDPLLHFLSLHLFLFGVTLIPITIGISALRFRLWRMDVLLNRTLVYGSLTAVIILLYIVVVGLLGAFFGRDGNELFAVLVTGLVAVFFNPLRQRLQHLANQLVYGQRDNPFAVMAALSKQLAETAMPNQTLPALVHTIAQALKLPYVAIVNNENDILAATSEKQFTTLHSFPLVYQSQKTGRLLIAPREVGDVFTVEEEKLLRNVARQAGTAVYAGQLTDQLQQSRERLVITREEERRRLRRDLHDGLGPQLAALTIKAGAAQNVLRSDPDKAGKLLTEIKTESQNAIKEIRQVVEGLRPPSLDQLGLLSALRQFAAQNDNDRLQITIQAPTALPSLPAAVEVAAYRIVTEAITNVMRHARAQTCQVCITVNGQLMLTIMDNGIGVPSVSHTGVGFLSMRERAEELGGTFEVISNEGQTLVTAVLPLPT